MTRFQRILRQKVKLSDEPAWRLAQMFGIDPTALSRWITGYSVPNPDDERVQKLAIHLGISPRIFPNAQREIKTTAEGARP